MNDMCALCNRDLPESETVYFDDLGRPVCKECGKPFVMEISSDARLYITLEQLRLNLIDQKKFICQALIFINELLLKVNNVPR